MGFGKLNLRERPHDMPTKQAAAAVGVQLGEQLFMKAAQLLFVVAQLLLAVGAGEGAVRVLVEAFGVHEIVQLPADEQKQAQGDKALGVGIIHHEQRREHHYIVPVVYPAGIAALVLHQPCLERAEEQDADHVAHRVEDRQQHHDAPIEDALHIQPDEQQVRQRPEDDDRDGAFI